MMENIQRLEVDIFAGRLHLCPTAVETDQSDDVNEYRKRYVQRTYHLYFKNT